MSLKHYEEMMDQRLLEILLDQDWKEYCLLHGKATLVLSFPFLCKKETCLRVKALLKHLEDRKNNIPYPESSGFPIKTCYFGDNTFSRDDNIQPDSRKQLVETARTWR